MGFEGQRRHSRLWLQQILEIVTIEAFQSDDDGYLRWVETNVDGFVVNCYRNARPGYRMLHRATCRTIKTPARKNYTTQAYMKVCSTDRAELEAWARFRLGGKVTRCGSCNP